MGITKSKKRLGQHFLKDPQVIRDLVTTAEVGPNDTILEVGAGTGVVTKELAERAAKVVAVEFDADLIPALKTNLAGYDNVEIVQADILTYQISTTVSKIVGSIPYQITSPLIHKIAYHLIGRDEQLRIALLIQKEVAQKICARPPRATYLSNFIGLIGRVEIVRIVKPGAFDPPPKVDSAIIKIAPAPSKILPSKEMEDFLHLAFSHPRKMLRHTFDQKELAQVGISSTARAQEIRLEAWLDLYNLRSARRGTCKLLK